MNERPSGIGQADSLFKTPIPTASAEIIDLENPQLVKESLTRFTEYLNAGRLDEIFAAQSKPHIPQPKGKKLASLGTKRHSFVDTEYSGIRFYFDADYSIAVGHQEEGKPTFWFAAVGFYAGNRLRRYDDKRRENFGKDSIVVVQMQGPIASKDLTTNNPVKSSQRDKATQIFQAYRTEFALLTLPVEWGKTARLAAAYVLPASKNKWMPTEQMIKAFPERQGDLRAKRLASRYDGTATRFGFQKTEHGFYKLQLDK